MSLVFLCVITSSLFAQQFGIYYDTTQTDTQLILNQKELNELGFQASFIPSSLWQLVLNDESEAISILSTHKLSVYPKFKPTPSVNINADSLIQKYSEWLDELAYELPSTAYVGSPPAYQMLIRASSVSQLAQRLDSLANTKNHPFKSQEYLRTSTKEQSSRATLLLYFPYSTRSVKLDSLHSISDIVYNPKPHKSDFEYDRFMRFVDTIRKMKNADQITIYLPASTISSLLNKGQASNFIPFMRALKRGESIYLKSKDKIERSNQATNFSILILLFVWASFVVHYSLGMSYRRSFKRFHSNRGFFLQDLNYWRVKTTASAIIIYIQGCIISSLIFSFFSLEVLSARALEFIGIHLPLLGYTANNFFAIFIFWMFIFLALNLVLVLPMVIANRKAKHFGQVFTLYFYGQHLHILVGSIILVVMLAQLSNLVALIGLGIYVCMIIANFFRSIIGNIQMCRLNPASFFFSSTIPTLILIIIFFTLIINRYDLDFLLYQAYLMP